MRLAIVPVTLLLLSTSGIRAQQPQAQPGRIEDILVSWEKAMANINTLVARCKRTTADPVFGKEEFEGTAKFARPSRASLHLESKTKDNRPWPGGLEKYVLNGSSFYEFEPKSKEIRVHKLPPPKSGQVADDNFLSFLFGMKASEAMKRYQVRLLPPPKGHEKWYYYIEIVPRHQVDKAEFTQARLVLWIRDHLPLQLWFREPNGKEITWDFPKLDVNVPLPPQEFNQPDPPPGWRLRRMEVEAPPRVFRQ